MNSHLSTLLLRLGDKLAADGSCEKTFLDAHQLRHSLHRRRELLPQTEELIPIYGGPLCVQRGDLRGIWTSVNSVHWRTGLDLCIKHSINRRNVRTRYRMCKSFSSTKPFMARWRSANTPRASGGEREEERVAAPS